jgi:hypothetical protein
MSYMSTQKALRLNTTKKWKFLKEQRRRRRRVPAEINTTNVGSIPTYRELTDVEKIISLRGDLRALRHNRGWTLDHVAANTNYLISPGAIGKIETGFTRSPRMDTVNLLSIAYGITLDQVFILIYNRKK